MPASVVTVELHMPAARSLKDKRRIVKSLKDKIFTRYRVSIAEIDGHDLRQSATLGIAAVAPTAEHLGDLMSSVRSIIDQRPDLIVTLWDERTAELAP
jgi:uncharacterized protein YlxP (DUF503 family)